MGRRFHSPGQRHQHNESTMTTGLVQNISPKAANRAQCSLITPQPAELRLQKTNLQQGMASSAFFPADSFWQWSSGGQWQTLRCLDIGVCFEYQNQKPG